MLTQTRDTGNQTIYRTSQTVQKKKKKNVEQAAEDTVCRSHDDVQSVLPLRSATLLLRRAIRSNCASNCCLTCGGRRQRVQPDCGDL